MNIKKFLGSSFIGGCAFSSAVSCSPATAVQEGNFEAELLQEFVQGGDLLKKFKDVAYGWADSIADLFKEGGLNDSSKESFVLWLNRFLVCVAFFDRINYPINALNEFEYEWSEYFKNVLPDWFLKLEDQYNLGSIPEDCIPAEHRETYRFFVEKIKRAMGKYML